MQFDTALNLVWLVFCVFALAGTLRARRSRGSQAVRTPAWLHVCGVALISTALFPYISATDDVLRIQHMDQCQSDHHDNNTSKNGPNDTLIRLYETMDTPVVCTVKQISFVLVFVSMVLVVCRNAVNRAAPLASGRAPPCFPATLSA